MHSGAQENTTKLTYVKLRETSHSGSIPSRAGLTVGTSYPRNRVLGFSRAL